VADPRAGLAPGQSSGNDALDRERGKGIYYVPGPAPSPPPPPPPPSPPPPPPPPPGQKQTSQVKVSNVNVVNLNYAQTPVEQLEKLYFQDVGGTEILAVARHDTIGGEPVISSPIDNLEDLTIQFNPLNILTSTKLDTLFAGYGIDITDNIPEQSRDAEGNIIPIVQINADGGMEIEVVGVNRAEYVQIQVASRVEEFGLGRDPSWYNTGEEQ